VVHKVGFSVSAAAVSQFVGRDLFNQWYALSAHVCLSTSSLIYLLTDELEDLEAVILNPDRSGGLIWNLADLETGPVRVCQRTGQTRSTRRVDPAGQPVTRLRPGQDPIFLFFKCEIWNLLVYIHYVPKKKFMFFQCGIKNFLI